MNKGMVIATVVLVVFSMTLLVRLDIALQELESTRNNLEDTKKAYYELYAQKEEKKNITNRVENAGEIYGIEPRLLEAIERLETGNYTSKIYKEYHNTWGAYDGRNYLRFENDLQSTVELARTLKFYYIDKGLDTIEKISKKYCPSDENWAIKVKQIYEQLGE